MRETRQSKTVVGSPPRGLAVNKVWLDDVARAVARYRTMCWAHNIKSQSRTASGESEAVGLCFAASQDEAVVMRWSDGSGLVEVVQ